MKIDSFDLDLGSTRRFTQTYAKQTTRRFSFVNIMDDRIERRLPGWGSADARAPAGTEPESSPWYAPVTVNGQEGVTLTSQFRFELEKMRQIMSAIMENFQKMMAGGCECHLDSIYEIYAMPVTRFSGFSFWEIQESTSVSYRESEQTMVSADGIVRTADNREINFSLDLKMERTFLQESYFSQTRTGYALIDPLIIQTDTAGPSLSGAEFSFDLDLDGETEDLLLPPPGTGFLALDLNNDGEINDGSELFGPTSGDGFSELAAYDLDHNDWIDENDPIFDRLTLWEQAEAGGMSLTRIKDAGIGAIYLKGVESPFDLRSEDNELLARVTKTSVALTEDGEALPVQEMDYKV